MATLFKTTGRPRGQAAILATQGRMRVAELVETNLEPIIMAMITAALGIYYERTTTTGITRIYTQVPNVDAARLLFENAWGKPKETVDHNYHHTLELIDARDDELERLIAGTTVEGVLEEPEDTQP